MRNKLGQFIKGSNGEWKGKKHKESSKLLISKINSGEKHPQYKHGKNCRDDHYIWNKQRKATLDRDNKSCQRCGTTEGRLAVHHIVPLKSFKNKLEAHKLDNLVTLCTHCHNVEEYKLTHPPKTIKDSKIGDNCTIWDFANIYNSEVGNNVTIGAYAELNGCKVGNNCKIECRAFLPRGVILEDNVFVGPGVLFTNDLYPRVNAKEWKLNKTLVKKGASIGAGSIISCGVTIEEGAMIGMGAIPTKDVPPNETWVGVPAKKIKQ